jgi:hypothetical protein
MGVGIIATSHQMIFQERFSELNSVVYAIHVERIPVCVGSLVPHERRGSRLRRAN